MKLLIADDSQFIRAILKGIIAQSKWSDAEIIEAVDGGDAVKKVHDARPDLVFLDLIMPVQDGIGVLK
jgi:YesN/AraC family two-component response regulator